MKSEKIYIIFLFFLWGCSAATAGGNSFVYSTPTTQEKEKFRDYIKKGYIELGMTKEEVRESWGEPKTVNHKKTKDYDEVWVYVPNWKFRNQLYFKGEILVGTEPNYLVVSRMEGHGVMP